MHPRAFKEKESSREASTTNSGIAAPSGSPQSPSTSASASTEQPLQTVIQLQVTSSTSASASPLTTTNTVEATPPTPQVPLTSSRSSTTAMAVPATFTQNSFPFLPPIHFATDPRTVELLHLPSISAPSSTTLNLEATLTSVPSLLSVRAVTPTPGLNVVPSPVPYFSISPPSPTTPSSPTSSSAFLTSASLLHNLRPNYFNNSPSASLSPGLEPGSRSCSPTTPFTQREATPPKESSMESSVVQVPEAPSSANLKLGPPLKRPKILQRRRREKKSPPSPATSSKKTTSEAKKKPSKRAKGSDADAAIASLLSIASAGSLDATAASLTTSPATSRRKSSPSPSPTDSPKTGDGTTAKPEKSAKAGRTCIYCGTSNTPEWRRGPDGNKSLCNACGLHFAKIVRKERESSTAPTTESPASVREKCSVSMLLS